MAAILKMTFSNSLSWMEIAIFWLKYDWILYLRFQLTKNQQQLDNGLVLYRPEAIIWTNGDAVH